MKIIRILVYEGDEQWIKVSLKSRAVVGEYTVSNGSIKEFYIQSPMIFPSEPPFDFEKEEKRKEK